MLRKIDVAFIGSDNKIIKVYTSVQPWKMLSNKNASFVLERISDKADFVKENDYLI